MQSYDHLKIPSYRKNGVAWHDHLQWKKEHYDQGEQ